jgi:hypothetical protein
LRQIANLIVGLDRDVVHEVAAADVLDPLA